MDLTTLHEAVAAIAGDRKFTVNVTTHCKYFNYLVAIYVWDREGEGCALATGGQDDLGDAAGEALAWLKAEELR